MAGVGEAASHAGLIFLTGQVIHELWDKTDLQFGQSVSSVYTGSRGHSRDRKSEIDAVSKKVLNLPEFLR